MYAVVCSDSTSSLWPTALVKLKEKYDRKWPGQVHVLTYTQSSRDPEAVTSCLPRLSEIRPSYCCFVAHHSECTKRFVSAVSKLTRELDPSHPYTDTVWGVLTGLTEEDVLFAIEQEPLVIRRVVGNCPVDLEKFNSGVWFSEFNQCTSFRKDLLSSGDSTGLSTTPPSSPPSVVEEKCPPDTTLVIASEVSSPRCSDKNQGVDMIISSAHASEKEWNIGFAFRSGKFLSSKGQLYGMSLDEERRDVQPNGQAKILSAAGNCSIGSICNSDCMALAWMHSANVVQMVGYLEPTWFGYGGWGVHNYFINNPGSMSFATAFFANQQSLLHLLHSKYNNHVETSLGEHKEVYTMCYNTTHPAREGMSRECSGLLYDRDNVAFYGDPAWEASLATNEQLYNYKAELLLVTDPEESNVTALDTSWSCYKYHVQTFKPGCWNTEKGDDKETSPGRPPICVFPWKPKEVKLLKGEAVLTRRFIMLPLSGEFTAGREFSALFAVKT